MAHDHYFEESNVEYFEDGAYIIHRRCTEYAKVYSVTHDDRHCETYIDGEKCDAIQRTRLDCTEVAYESSNGEWVPTLVGDSVLTDQYENHQLFIERLCDTIYREICQTGGEVQLSKYRDSDVVSLESEDFDGPVTIYVDDGAMWRLTFDNKEQYVDY